MSRILLRDRSTWLSISRAEADAVVGHLTEMYKGDGIISLLELFAFVRAGTLMTGQSAGELQRRGLVTVHGSHVRMKEEVRLIVLHAITGEDVDIAIVSPFAPLEALS